MSCLTHTFIIAQPGLVHVQTRVVNIKYACVQLKGMQAAHIICVRHDAVVI